MSNPTEALKELQAIKAPVFVHEDSEYHFVISGECNFAPQYGDEYWADYYVMTDGGSKCLDDFGVSPKLNEILNKHGLYAEWNDPGTIHVYDI